ncbi:TetR family transcriptional regulator [Dactylosporangium sp. NPDC000555]|uniref:TetR/AcrR family transcriptional regulator n=1 Tax=Dactylosporangium sp. NPDC000555 TaxID=3154260 RepID=UPI00332C89CB
MSWPHQIVTELKMQPGNECYPGKVIEPVGLRARKKVRTRDVIADAAISLFLARGFDQVSVSEIAATAEVSKPTLFRYFATKEDLILHRFADHHGEAARVVRDRRSGIAPMTALHRHFRAGLDRFEPVTGLNDHPEVVAFHRLVFTTPSLAGRLMQYMLDDEDALAAVLGPGIGARLQAAQVIAVQRVLARTNWQKIAGGRTARDVQLEAVADADQAFAQLCDGTGGS